MLRLRLRPELALVLVLLGLYVGAAAQVRSPRGSALAVATGTLARPFVSLANAVTGTFVDLAAGRRDIRAVLAELGQVRAEAAELRRTNQVLSVELAELRAGSALLAAFPSLAAHGVLARVVARDIPLSNTVRLDHGRDEGIRVDSAVIAGAGVMGRVDLVEAHSCRVQLLSHPAAAAAARVEGLDPEALLVGGESPRLTDLPPYTEVASGKPVLTTGSEGIYPPGLLLGMTGEARNDGLFTVVDVDLAVRPSQVDVVLVVPPRGSGS